MISYRDNTNIDLQVSHCSNTKCLATTITPARFDRGGLARCLIRLRCLSAFGLALFVAINTLYDAIGSLFADTEGISDPAMFEGGQSSLSIAYQSLTLIPPMM